MTKKALSIKIKIYFFSGILFVFAVIFLLFSFLFYSKYEEVESIKDFTESFNNQFREVQKIKNQILIDYQVNKELAQVVSSEIIQQLSDAENIFYLEFNNFSEKKSIRKNVRIAQFSDSLKSSFEQHSVNVQALISALQQRGTKNSALIGNIISSGESLVSYASGNFPNSVLTKEAQQLLLLLQQQAYEKDPLIKNTLNSKINELKIELADKGVEVAEFDKILETISSDISALVNLDAYIGFTKEDEGLITEINSDFQKGAALIKTLNKDLSWIIKKSKYFLTLFFILSIISITALIIYLFVRGAFKTILTPIENIFSTLSDLAKGKLSDKQVVINTSNELIVITEDINKLILNLRSKAEFAHSLNTDQLNSSIDLLSYDDVLGIELQTLQKNMQLAAEERQKHDEENARRRYINEGLAKFSEISHAGFDKIEKLTDVFIREVTKYLNCLQGGIFLIDDENEKEPTLMLSSAFAYNRKKYLTKKIPLGLGLVGTCALDKKTIHLTEIPKDYMMITSGLGEAPPQNLLLVPMLIDNNVLGVIEVASLNKFKNFEIEFIEQVATSLASTITATRTNERTAKLLTQSQQYTQEMAEQEEEMRQNMEELKATQEESSRREEEFRGIVDALSQALFVSEYDLNGELININEKLLIFLGKKREEVLGNSFKSVVNGVNSAKVDNVFLEEILNGKTSTLMDIIKIGRGKEYHIQFQFTAVLNKDSLPIKYLCLGIELKK